MGKEREAEAYASCVALAEGILSDFEFCTQTDRLVISHTLVTLIFEGATASVYVHRSDEKAGALQGDIEAVFAPEKASYLIAAGGEA